MVQKLNALSYSKLVCSAARMNEEERERVFTQPFILPGKVIRAEWYKSFPLVENIIETSTAKLIPALNNKFEIISFCYNLLRKYLSLNGVLSKITNFN